MNALTAEARALIDRQSHPDNLEGLLCRAQHRITDAQLSDLTEGGLCARMLGVDQITVADGLWRRRFLGSDAWILPVFTATGIIIDLLALPHDRPPSVYWLYSGAGTALGWQNIIDADNGNQPLFLHQSPTDWLRSGEQGACILNWRRLWAAELAHVSSIRVHRAEFGIEVQKRLQRPFSVPPIEVRA